MGLQDKPVSVVYLRIREHSYIEEGKEKTKYGFATGKDTMPYSELEGVVTRMFFVDEDYEGNKLRKLITVVTDPSTGVNYQFGLNVESAAYYSLVSFIRNVDLSKPVTFYPRIENITRDGRNISRRSILISQEGTFAKSYFTKDDPKGLPAWKSVTVSGKTMADKTDYLNFLENFVTTEIAPKVGSVAPVAQTPTTPEFKDIPTTGFINDSDDDFPWMTD